MFICLSFMEIGDGTVMTGFHKFPSSDYSCVSGYGLYY